MRYYVGTVPYTNNYLSHYGILGMKWGVRRYQNPDGTWTAAGKKRYGRDGSHSASSSSTVSGKKQTSGGGSNEKSVDWKKVAKVGAIVAGTALVAYGAYKVNELATDRLITGDRFASSNMKAIADLHLDTMYSQERDKNAYINKLISENVPRTNSRWSRLNSMHENERIAAKKYNQAYDEFKRLRDRANSGKYTVKEKAGAVKEIVNSKRSIGAAERETNRYIRRQGIDYLKYRAERMLPLSVIQNRYGRIN